MACAGVVEQDASHHLRGDGEELRPTFPARVVLIAETQPRLVYERGWLERMALALVPERELCLTTKLGIHQANE
jgi:hypothetical protein